MEQLSAGASRQGELWGYAYRDWVEFQEPTMHGLWSAVLDEAGVGNGTRLLDAGCGSGGALVVAAQRGAMVSGVDPSVNMITVARERLPNADLRIAELENLPFPNASFDAACAMNSLQFTTNPQLAIHELGRVCHAGGRVVIALHGDPARSDMAAVTEAIFGLFEKRPSGGPFALSSAEVLRSLVDSVSGLSFDAISETVHDSDYASVDTAVRGMMSAGGSRRAAEILGDERVREATREALARFVAADGRVRLRNAYWIARAVKHQ